MDGTERRKDVEEIERVKSRVKSASDEPDVEAHRFKDASDAEGPGDEAGRVKGETDEPDVEAHRFKS